MLSKKVEKALNEQIAMEAAASQKYLAMACWCDEKALEGCANFLYTQADEERMHMMKLVHYINESGGRALTPAIAKPQQDFDNILNLFEIALENEKAVSVAIDKIVDVCEKERDKQTANFLEWFVEEQHEEESLYRSLIDRVKLIGLEGRGLYFIDKEVETVFQQKQVEANGK